MGKHLNRIMGWPHDADPDEATFPGADNDESIHGIFTPLGMARMVEPQWLIRDLIPKGVFVFGGPPKSLKSTLVMAASAAVAGYEGQILPEGMNEVTEHGNVVGISYEASAGELAHIVVHDLKVKLEEDERILIADDPWEFQLDDPDGLNKLIHWLDVKKAKLGWVDPFAESHSLEENDSRAMIQIIRPLHKWAKTNNASFGFMHHCRKKTGDDGNGNVYTPEDLRGSSAIFGKMDGVIMLTPHEEPAGLLTIVARFKRGKSWRRDVQFEAYGNKGGVKVTAAPHEVLDDVAKMVLGVVAGGVVNHSAIGKQLRISKRRVGEAIDACVRVGALARHGKKLTVCKDSSKKPKSKKTKVRA